MRFIYITLILALFGCSPEEDCTCEFEPELNLSFDSCYTRDFQEDWAVGLTNPVQIQALYEEGGCTQ